MKLPYPVTMPEKSFPGQRDLPDISHLPFFGKKAIAIIGMGMRFPANIHNESEMWASLMSGKSAISVIPEERWPTDMLQHPTRGEPGRSVNFAAGVLEEAELFDAAFFNISPREASWMDPQQRLLLEMAHEAMDDAGLPDREYRGSDCGVYIGISGMDYGQNALMDLSSMTAHSMTGNTLSIAANRISYVFDLHGPSLAIDTACSSSLAAFHEACQAINSGAIPMALTGGINMLMHPYPFLGFSHASMLSASGQCRPFDARGDGYVRGEGGALMLLKPLEAAIADGNHIHAVILGSGINADGGGKKGLTIPESKAQATLMSSVLAKCDLSPDDLAYVEAHGTGTAVGDPIEASSIGKAYGIHRSKPLPISSAKANFGHLEPASGMVGLIKAILALKHGQIPPMPFPFVPNPDIDFAGLNLYCAAEGARIEKQAGKPLICAVNSFGFGGLNAHVLLGESPAPERPSQVSKDSAEIVLPPLFISARTQKSLEQLAGRYARHLETIPEEKLHDFIQNAVAGRSFLEYRLAVRGKNRADFISALKDFEKGSTSSLITTEKALPGAAKIGFVYSGNGAQWYGMGRQLYAESAKFASVLNLLDQKLAKVTGWSVLDVLFNASEETLQDTTHSQPLLFAIQVALTCLLEEMGIKPYATCGHSVGEIAAAWCAGQLTLDEAIEVIHARSTAQGKTRGQGRMAVVGLGDEDIHNELNNNEISESVELAAVNSPHNTTLSGDEDSLSQLGERLREKNVFFRMLNLDYAFHSHYMDEVKGCLEDMLRGLSPAPDEKAVFISTVDANYNGPLDAPYWWHNMRKPVRFDAAIKKMLALGVNVFVEIGPHAILQRYIRENFPANIQARVIPTMSQSNPGLERIKASASSIYLLFPDLAISSFFKSRAPWMALPSYPWEHQKFTYPRTAERIELPSRTAPLLGWQLSEHTLIWENILDPIKDKWLEDHQVGGSVVFPAAGYIELALEAGAQWQKGKALMLENFDIFLPMLFENNKARLLRCEINATDSTLTISSRSRLENEPWLAHARCRLLFHTPQILDSRLKDISASRGMTETELYGLTQSLGLDYGSFFRRVESVAIAGSTLEATLKPDQDASFIIHPAYLDAAFHSLAALYATGQNSDPYLPTGFKTLKIYSTNFARYVRCNILKTSRRTIHADFELLDDNRKPVATISDCRFGRLAAQLVQARVKSWSWEKIYKPLRRKQALPSIDLRLIADKLLREHSADPERRLWLLEILPRLEGAVIACVSRLLAEQGADFTSKFPPSFASWISSLLPLCQNYTSEEAPDWKDIWREAHTLAPNMLNALLPVARALDRLPSLAEGKDMASVSTANPHTIAQENSAANPAYKGVDKLIADFLAALFEDRQIYGENILELSAYRQDVPFLTKAANTGKARYAQILSASNGSVTMPTGGDALLVTDPIQWLSTQDSEQRWDIIIIRQLMHRTPAVRTMLEDMAQRLNPGGVLLLAERYPDWSADLTSGLADAWWKESSDGKFLSPRMHPESWLSTLKDCGFEECGFISEPEAEDLNLGSYLVYARNKKDAHEISTSPSILSSWLIINEEGGSGLARALAKELLQQGQQVATIDTLSNAPQGSAPDNVVYILGRNGKPDEIPALLAQLNKNIVINPLAKKHWIVTSGGQLASQQVAGYPVDPAQCAITGFARVAHNEKPDLDLRLRDLEGTMETAAAARALAEEFLQDTKEDEVYLSEDGRYILSLNEEQALQPRTTERIRLDISQPGRLDRLKWIADQASAPGDGEVEARVMAVGLNFRDVMLAMGLLPEDAVENGFAGPTLGLEFSGIITKTGKGVTDFAPGDKVTGFAPACFASHVHTPQNAITHMPEGLDFASAAAFPTVFITAWYALKHLARIEKGDKLLIHGGAGGVGLAAIQIGKLLGAEVYVTVGTEEKRDYLHMLGVKHIFDSRSLDFADEIRELTDGHGVDVVLNSLAGEAMRRSLSLLAPFGRFLELGKRDYVENTSVGLKPFKENISYFSIDVDQLLTARPELANHLFREVIDELAKGKLNSIPWRSFESAHIEEAFRTMQQSRHMGKIVVDMSQLPPPDSSREQNSPEYSGVWLVSGGVEGFGLDTARYLASRGVPNIVLASRRGDKIADAERLRAEFAAMGADVVLKSCDFTKSEEVKSLIDWIRANLAPLTGVIHAAAVFDDRRLEEMDQDSFMKSLYPKILGAINLHEATLSQPPKHFILFSSISVALGNPGQGNYVAANAALEGITLSRNAQNLPSSCIAWGPIGESGYLSRNQAVRDTLARQLGYPPLTVSEAMDAFDQYAARDGVHILANVNWSRALEFSPDLPARLEKVHTHDANDASNQETSDLLQSLLAMDQKEALEKLANIIGAETAKVLGMDAGLVPHDRSLQAMGMDSLMAMELALSIEHATGLRLPPMLLQDAPTIDHLAQRLLDRMAPTDSETPPEATVLAELARRHSERLDNEDIQNVLQTLENS